MVQLNGNKKFKGCVNMFTHIQKVTLSLSFIAQAKGRLPAYLGSTLRGLIGHSLRKMVCATPKVKCHVCPVASNCDYANYFMSPKNAAGSVNRMILTPITGNQTEWRKGDACYFDVTLLSDAPVPLFIQVFENMNHLGWGAARLPFKLQKIINKDTGRLVWFNHQTWYENILPQPLTVSTQQASSVLLTFTAPLRLEQSKVLIENPEFYQIIQAIARRLELLSKAYTTSDVTWDYASMLAAAKAVKLVDCEWQPTSFTRYSMNQKNQALTMEVLTGWGQYEGDITPFTPLLEAGSLLHIGRNATHGFGSYHINYA